MGVLVSLAAVSEACMGSGSLHFNGAMFAVWKFFTVSLIIWVSVFLKVEYHRGGGMT